MISTYQPYGNVAPFIHNNKRIVDEEGNRIVNLVLKAFISEESLSTAENVGTLEENDTTSLYLNTSLATKYIFHNSFLVPLLLEAEKVIREYFTDDELFLEAILNELLATKYTFHNSFETTKFIKNNSFLVPLLLEAEKVIREYFTDEELFLEVIHDAEDIDFEELIIFIHTNLSPKEALDRLDKIDEEWWIDASIKSKGKLNINIEFE